MLSKITKLISSKPLLVFILSILAMIMIWFFSSRLGYKGFYPWKEESARLISVVVIFLGLVIVELFFLVKYLKKIKKKKNDISKERTKKPFEDEIVKQTALLDNYLSYLKVNWHGASRLWSKGYLYSIPWYLTLGDQGSGKSSLLRNSDLSFLLDDSASDIEFLQADRDFEWWVSDDAVIIDPKGNLPRTGRAVGSHKEAHLWDAFLQWLKVSRERRPLNGIIVTLSVERLINQSEDKRSQLAMQMRRQIQYLNESLGLRTPVYFFITKLDVFDGFLDYFENISNEERHKPFGISFPVEAESSSYWHEHFKKQYHHLVYTINDQLDYVLAKAESNRARNSIYSFVRQMAGFQSVLEAFLLDVFLEDRYSTPPFIRGVYFSSAYQQSVPLNAMSSSASQRYDISVPDYPSRKGRSEPFFTKQLFHSLILAESGLAGNSWMAIKKKQKQNQIAFLASGVVVCGLTTGWWFYYQKNLQASQHILGSVKAYATSAISNNGNSESQYLPQLNLLRNALDEYGTYRDESSSLAHMGLYKGKKVAPTVDTTYQNILAKQFMPIIANKIIEEIQADVELPEHERKLLGQQELASLRISRLIIESPKNTESDSNFVEQRTKLVVPYMQQKWQKMYRGDKNTQADLVKHLKYALTHVGAEMSPEKQDLLVKTQQNIGKMPLEERLYHFLKIEAKKVFPKPLDLRIAAGTSFGNVFDVKASRSLEGDLKKDDLTGEPEKDPNTGGLLKEEYPTLIPSFYTYEGYHKFFIEKHNEITDMASVDAWALGNKNDTKDYSEKDIDEIKAKIQSLYVRDYERYWRRAINSLFVQSFKKEGRNRYDIGLALKILSETNGGKNPFRGVLSVVKKNTILYPSILNKNKSEEKSEDESTSEDKGEKTPEDLLVNVANPLSNTFFRLNDLIEVGDKDKAYIDEIEVAFSNLYDYLKQIESDPDSNAYALKQVMNRLEMKADDDPIYTLQRIANGLSDPLRSQFNYIAEESWKVVLTLAMDSLDEQWQTEVYQLYKQNVQGRYPLTKTAADEISLRNFEEFFIPDGILDEFYKKYLKVLLEDNLSEVYSPETNFVLITPDVLKNLKKAEQIRKGFFNKKGGYNVKFSIEATSLSRVWRSAVLNVDGQTLKYNHGPSTPVEMIWPNSLEEVGASKVSFSPLGNSENARTIARKGSWSWFRLLDESQNFGTGSNIREFGFAAGKGNIKYKLRVDDPLNPLTQNLFSGFSLPSTLTRKTTAKNQLPETESTQEFTNKKKWKSKESLESDERKIFM